MSRAGPLKPANVLKAFATSVASVLVALVSAAFFGFHLSSLFFVGAAGVIYAVFLYGDLLQNFSLCRDCPPYLGGKVAEPDPFPAELE